MLLGSCSGLTPGRRVPVTPPWSCRWWTRLARSWPRRAAAADLSSTGAVVGVDEQPATNDGDEGGEENFFMEPPAWKGAGARQRGRGDGNIGRGTRATRIARLARIGTPRRFAHIGGRRRRGAA